jgi:hypothetical protein
VAHPGLPHPTPRTLSKTSLLTALRALDTDEGGRARVLSLESSFRTWIDAGIAALPTENARFAKFSTSPYVLLIYSKRRGYSAIRQIEADILPAKVFSSMETSAGRMIEEVALPTYGWEVVPSGMHSPNSALDGRKIVPGVACVATLKSGPRCLNDEMAENFADAVLNHAATWAGEANVERVEFTYGVLYGTQKLSNKKDWHILRNIAEKVVPLRGTVVVPPAGLWECTVQLNGIEIAATVRIGMDWWEYLGGHAGCALEIWVAMIRACIPPGDVDDPAHQYVIQDLGGIVSLAGVAPDYNVALLQRSQIPWLFFIARHFADTLTP